MFDPSQFTKRETARRSVAIAMSDGTDLTGILVVPVARTMVEMLNSPREFFEFESDDGEKLYLAKSAIQAIRITDVPSGMDARVRRLNHAPAEIHAA